MATISSQENIVLDQTIPQWKRELILRRRTSARSLPAGNTTVKLTRPSIVSAVRQVDQGPSAENILGKQCNVSSVLASNKGIADQEQADFHPRGRIGSESDSTSATGTSAVAPPAVTGNMRLVEHIVDAGSDFMFNGLDDSTMTADEKGVRQCSKMGEESSVKKMTVSCRTAVDNSVLSENNNSSHPQDDCHSDSSEELEYGPGIVNKLRSKYLSMTLRESQNKGLRPSLVSLRRATSLENMLDSDGVDTGKPQIKTQPRFVKREEVCKNTNKPQKTFLQNQRYRPVSRGNDSLKRARSVEALYRNELKVRGIMRHMKSSAMDINKNNAPVIKPLGKDEIIIVENKNRLEKMTDNKGTAAPNQKIRQTNVAPVTEMPPPDVVKQTLKIFETTPNQKLSSFHTKTGTVRTKGNGKPSLPPKLLSDKVRMQSVNKSSPRRSLTVPSPEPQPLLSVNRSGLQDNSATPPLSPSSPTSGIRRLKSPSPTIESKQAMFTKDIIESEQGGQMLPNGKQHVRKGQREADTSDNDGDGDTTDCSVKTVSPKVLENIRKDGLSLQFSFENNGNDRDKFKTYLPAIKTLGQIEQASPLLLPAVFVEMPPMKIIKSAGSNPVTVQAPAKQIGVIRPMVTNKPQVTVPASGREMEKNLINREKLNDQPKSQGTKKEIEDVTECIQNSTSSCENNVLPSKLRSTKGSDQPQNIMVFNFSNRKDPPPDYIPDDGLNMAPKPIIRQGEKGVLILEQPFSGESSTDEITSGPPSPCNVTFEGANVLINGRSNLRKQPRASKFHITFNDSATTTFEYPSEASLLEPEEDHHLHLHQSRASDDTVPSSLLPSNPAAPTPGIPVPLGGSSLASYTPSKVRLGSEDFQLGVTRAPQPLPASEASGESTGATAADAEQEEYLKPAEESETVAWSAETTADLLF